MEKDWFLGTLGGFDTFISSNNKITIKIIKTKLEENKIEKITRIKTLKTCKGCNETQILRRKNNNLQSLYKECY